MKNQYISCTDFTFEDEEMAEAILSTHTISKEVAQNLDYYGLLSYDDNDMLVDAKQYSYDEFDEEINGIESARGEFKYRNWPERAIYTIEFADEGEHYLGGDIPNGFTMPKLNFVAPTLYLGMIDNNTEGMEWLPSPLHLVCPIHHNFEAFYLDYSNPNAPISINNEAIDPSDCAYDAFTQDSFIVYNKANFNFEQSSETRENGMAGVPLWIQHPQIPRCPKTNNIMRFVCQLDGGVSATSHNIVPENDFYAHYYEEMNFWGSGILYVFFEPNSKVACYIIQTT